MPEFPAAPHLRQASRSDAEADVGRVLGHRYRLLAHVGSGSSAHVYVAEDLSLGRQVAVKCLRPGLSGDARFLRRFRAEAKAAAQLSHPNLLAVYDWGEHPTPYLVTELLLGGTLLDMMGQTRRLSMSQGLLVGLQVAKGLDYAHDLGIVHRDIKPANLLFGEEGRLRIADFGIARAVAETAWTEPEGVMVGTARYAAPEQALGDGIDGKADVYSLALTVIEAVTGSVPLLRENALATMVLRQDRDVVDLAGLGSLGSALVPAGRADPESRPTAAELMDALTHAARSLPRPERLPLVRPVGDVIGSGGPVSASIEVIEDVADFEPSEMSEPSDLDVGLTGESIVDLRPLIDSGHEGWAGDPLASIPLSVPGPPSGIDTGELTLDDRQSEAEPPIHEVDDRSEVDVHRWSPRFEIGDVGSDAAQPVDDADRATRTEEPPGTAPMQIARADSELGSHSSRFAEVKAFFDRAAERAHPEAEFRAETEHLTGPDRGPYDKRGLDGVDPDGDHVTDPGAELGADGDHVTDPGAEFSVNGGELGADGDGVTDPDDHLTGPDAELDLEPELSTVDDLLTGPEAEIGADDDLAGLRASVDGLLVAPDARVGRDGQDEHRIDDELDSPTDSPTDSPIDSRIDGQDEDEPGDVDHHPEHDLEHEHDRESEHDHDVGFGVHIDGLDDSPVAEEQHRSGLLNYHDHGERPYSSIKMSRIAPSPFDVGMPAGELEPAPTRVAESDSGTFIDDDATLPARSELPRRRWLVPTVAGLIAAAAIAIVVWTVIDQDLFRADPAPATTIPSAVEVADVVGLSVADVVAEIESNGWVLSISERRAGTTDPGEIVSQDPPPGQILEPGATLSIVVSLGPELRALPELEGLTLDGASSVLRTASLRLGVVTEQPDDQIPAGTVMGFRVEGAEVADGAELESGTPVDLIVSSGPLADPMPSFVGLTLDAALAQADELGLVVTRGEAFTDVYPEGFIVDTTPPTSTPVALGDALTLVVSLGPPFVTVPDVVGLDAGEAADVLSAAGFAVTDTEGPANLPVIATSPAAGESQRKGSPVVVRTAVEPVEETG